MQKVKTRKDVTGRPAAIIGKKIHKLDKQFDFVLTAMIPNWYRTPEGQQETGRQYLTSWLSAGYQLYQHLLAKFESLADK